MSASWFLVSMYLVWIFGSKLIRSNNQSSATLWVLETCLIVGLLPSMIILITSSLSSKTYNKTSWREEMTFEGIRSTFSKSLITPWDCFRFWIVWGVERTSRFFINGSTRSLWLWFVFPRTATIRSHKSKCGDTIQSQSSVQRDGFWFCWTVWNWSLFLTHPTYWNKCMTSKHAMFLQKWILNPQDHRKSRVLKQSKSALFSSITHIAILFVFTCVMNVWNQSIQAFVTSFGPFCNRSCKFIHWP